MNQLLYFIKNLNNIKMVNFNAYKSYKEFMISYPANSNQGEMSPDYSCDR